MVQLLLIESMIRRISGDPLVEQPAGEAAMSCHKHLLTLQWEHHHWRPHVASSEVLTMSEMNIWCRVVDKPYVRCDKQMVCEVCGKAGKEWSCVCDMQVAEHCRLRNASLCMSQPV